MSATAIVHALEALEDFTSCARLDESTSMVWLPAEGIAHVRAILLAGLEDAPVADPDGRRRRCGQCGVGPLWPGELETHTRVIHDNKLPPPPTRPARRLVRSTPGGRR